MFFHHGPRGYIGAFEITRRVKSDSLSARVNKTRAYEIARVRRLSGFGNN
ncbi:hypothetical protein LG3211_5027 [Lysobacter gummosus]|nr:hypothetical protein LG3211_5027 [Lysobacter gummosus]